MTVKKHFFFLVSIMTSHLECKIQDLTWKKLFVIWNKGGKNTSVIGNVYPVSLQQWGQIVVLSSCLSSTAIIFIVQSSKQINISSRSSSCVHQFSTQVCRMWSGARRLFWWLEIDVWEPWICLSTLPWGCQCGKTS